VAQRQRLHPVADQLLEGLPQQADLVHLAGAQVGQLDLFDSHGVLGVGILPQKYWPDAVREQKKTRFARFSPGRERVSAMRLLTLPAAGATANLQYVPG